MIRFTSSESLSKNFAKRVTTPLAGSSGRATRQVSKQRAFVLVAVMVIFAFAMTLFGLWAKAAVARNRQTRGREFRVQAERLAEAGLERARAQRSSNTTYDGETWKIPAGVIHPTRTANVFIRVTPSDEGRALSIEARAEYPAGALHRARITRTVDIPN